MTGAGTTSMSERRSHLSAAGVACTLLVLLQLLCLALALATASAALAQNGGPWAGVWETRWRDGGAHLSLQQEGDRVTGTYMPFNGRVEGTVADGSLVGQWTDSGNSGTFEFTLSPDGQTFLGRFESGEWWNGRRIEHPARLPLSVNLTSPRAAMRTFLVAANEFRRGDFPAAEIATQAVDFGPDAATLTDGEEIEWATDLFRVLDRLTFRIWRLPAGGPRPVATATLEQAGTGRTVEIRFRRDDARQWRIVAPARATLQATLRELRVARGEPAGGARDLASERYHGLHSARDAMRSFFDGMRDLDQGGDGDLALRALDLSEIPPRIRDLDAPLLADYLQQVLNRVSFVVWQEIPDDPAADEPYVFFQHAAGSIVIAPGKDEDGGTVWRFSAETMANMRDLYTAIEDVPLVDRGLSAGERPLYFQMRDRMRAISPALLQRELVLENWQWLGILCVLLAGALVGTALQRAAVYVLRQMFPRADAEFDRELRLRLLWPSRVLMTVLVVIFGINRLGLADDVYRPLQTLNFLIVAGATAWLLYNLIVVASDLLHRQAKRSSSYVDEIMISLVSGVLRAIVVIGAVFVIADMLSIPYQGVLAGLGFGGLALAFAAQSTVANLFGAAVLLGDRPFRRGDLIAVNGVTGIVEHVGIRSTRVRTDTESLIVIPNATLAGATIDNCGSGRQRQVQLMLKLAHDTPAARITALVDALPAIVATLPRIVPAQTSIGASDVATGSIDVLVECLFDASSTVEERAARHALIVAVCAAVETQGIKLAAPMPTSQPAGPELPVQLEAGGE